MAATPHSSWRLGRYQLGAWAYILHRLSGAVIALYGVAHILVMAYARSGPENFDRLLALLQQRWVLALEMPLIAVILYHMFNGFRIILFDLGIAIRRQKPLFWGLMALGAALMGLTLAYTWPYLKGRPLI